MLKDYDMSFIHHPGKVNAVADDLCRMTIGNVSYVRESKKDLVKDVHRIFRMGVRLEDSLNGGFMVHHNSKSSFVFKVKFRQHLDQSLMELKELAHRKNNESFSFGGMVFMGIKKGCVFPM